MLRVHSRLAKYTQNIEARLAYNQYSQIVTVNMKLYKIIYRLEDPLKYYLLFSKFCK